MQLESALFGLSCMRPMASAFFTWDLWDLSSRKWMNFFETELQGSEDCQHLRQSTPAHSLDLGAVRAELPIVFRISFL